MTKPRVTAVFLLLALSFVSMSHGALAAGPMKDVATLEDALETLIPKAPKGALSWQTLGKAEVIFNEDDGTLSPRFPKEVKDLDGKEINIVGFLFPIETGEKQRHFLLSALPPSCPFCLPAGPNYLIDVNTSEGITFGYDPVRLKGTLQLLDASDDYQMFYRLNNAKFFK